MGIARGKALSRVLPTFAALVICLWFGLDLRARALAQSRIGAEAAFGVVRREVRIDSWAARLPPIEVVAAKPDARATLRLYADTGEIDDGARAEFERVVANDTEPHVLAARLEQLVFKAAYRFKAARINVVSGWREHAGRHTAGDALDFKLQGISAAILASYLRGLSRVGVGIYTHPRTQFVHLDVRDQSYHWLDASPPGVKWRERQMRDGKATKRDEAWTPDADLPD